MNNTHAQGHVETEHNSRHPVFSCYMEPVCTEKNVFFSKVSQWFRVKTLIKNCLNLSLSLSPVSSLYRFILNTLQSSASLQPLATGG